MRMLRGWLRRLGGLFDKPRRDRDLDEELESHLQLHMEDGLREGLTPAEARRRAMVQLGGIEATKEACRDQRGLPWLESLGRDARYASRQLRKSPGFTAVAVLTLALGIGANTSLFTAINTVLLKPLPAQEADRLVYVASGQDEDFSFPFYERLRQSVSSLSVCAAVQIRVAQRELSDSGTGGEAESIPTQAVSGSFFTGLGVPPLLGRALNTGDDRLGAAEPVVVISHSLWQRRFAGDPSIIGRGVRLDNVSLTIVGVMPPGFVGFQPDVNCDVWWPLQLVSQFGGRERNALSEGFSWLVLFGRLREGVTREQAQAEVTTFFRRQLEDEVAKNPHRPPAERERILSRTLDLHSGAAGYVGARREFKQPLIILMAAVGVVLLIASTNIAGLLLARGAARQREFAVRSALGAGRGRIVRQLVTESVLLALAGGIVGLVFAQLGTSFLTRFLAQSSAPVILRPDGRVLLFTVVVSLGIGVLFGLAPALRLSRLDLVATIKNQGGGMAGPARGRLQPSLIVAQVALSVLLLAGAGLFARTLHNLRTADFGFQRENLLSLSVGSERWRPAPAESNALLKRLLSEMEVVPGVRGISVGGAGLLTGSGLTMDFAADGYAPAPGEEMKAKVVLAGPRFFEALRVPLLRGREFTSADEPAPAPDGADTHAKVAIIGETMARRYFGNADPIGRHITVDGEEKVRLEIVGVAKETKYSRNVRDETPLEFYIPYFGSGIRMPPTFYLRTDQSAEALVPEIRRIVAQVEPRLTIRRLLPMDEVIDRLLVRERIIAQLVGFFSLFALLLASLGLYGILSFRVAQRTREIGVRMALGATLQNVAALVIRQGLLLVMVGSVLGVCVALVATRFVATLLYGVTPADPFVFAAVVAVLLAVALAACWLPARRASRIEPMSALRAE